MKRVQEIKELVRKLNIYSDAYYNRVSIIEDAEYDKLYERLEELEKETGYVLSNSPTRKIGFEVVSNLEKVKHKKKMYSLQKTKTVLKIMKLFGDNECISSLKLDGLATEIEYKNGKLFRASTRGDGIVGEDITHAVKVYKNIPLTLPLDIDITITGESIIKIGDFNHFNEKLPADMRFKNPRNAVSGTVRNLNSSVVKDRCVRFIAYDISETNIEKNDNTYLGTLKFLSSLGFSTVPNITGANSVIFEELSQYAKLTGFGIDGVVIRLNDDYEYNRRGFTSKFPHGALAYKFDDENEVTTLLDIEWSMGRSGTLTPVAVFEPVELEGTTVERASLHNISQIEKLGLGGKGSIIQVQKSNQIIPQVVGVEEKVGELNIPTHCPYCGMEIKVVMENATKELICNNIQCSEQLVMEISHFTSRNALNIKGISEERIRVLVKHGLLLTPFSLFRLRDRVNEIKAIEGFADKNVKQMIESIDKAKYTTLDRFISALGIPLIGFTTSKEISNKFKTIDNLLMASLDDFKQFLGDAKSNSIYSFLNENKKYINALLGCVYIEKPKENISNVLEGKSFCFTGSCKEFCNRSELKEFVTDNGGMITSSVTSKTGYLIANKVEDSVKYKNALKYNVKIISEKELISMVMK